MYRLYRRLAALAVLCSIVGVAPPAFAQSTATCQFVLGFATLHDAIPSVVGACIDDEGHNPANGDGLQHTVNGLLVWRKADNFTAFTDGFRSWVDGPYGLAERLNDQRFSWEANPDRLPVVVGTTVTEPASSAVSSTVATTSTSGGPPRSGDTKRASATSGAAGTVADPDPANVAGHTFSASSHPSATLIYCDDDPAWKNLSPKYLKHYGSWAEAHAAYPDRTLHQAC